MGGNALSNPGIRLNKSDYDKVEEDITETLIKSGYYLGLDWNPIRSYESKYSFGDMDILFKSEGFDPYKVAGILGAEEVVRNGSVTSIGISIPGHEGLFQVDLISVKDMQSAYTYFNYNDLGNLMGKIAHKMGFKYGHEGLKYVIRDKDNSNHVVKEITVSTDSEKIFRFLGYSYSSYLLGFGNLNEIFRFISSSMYFNPDIYLFDNLNHTSRIRDKKRKTYNEFLAWCRDSFVSKSNFDWSDKEVLRESFLNLAFAYFPGFKEEYQKEYSRFELVRKAKEKYNGELVFKLTLLEGKELGAFMKYFKEITEEETGMEFYYYISDLTPETIEMLIKTSYTKWKMG